MLAAHGDDAPVGGRPLILIGHGPELFGDLPLGGGGFQVEGGRPGQSPLIDDEGVGHRGATGQQDRAQEESEEEAHGRPHYRTRMKALRS